MQRLNMIQGYHALTETAGAVFQQPVDNSENSRLVKMRIITEQDVVLKVSDCEYDPETGEVGEPTNTRLLTVVRAGFDEVEFYYLGTFVLNVLGGDILLDTFDNAFVSTEASDLTNYARLWEREERDPRILEIERQARHNQQRLADQMAQDFARYASAMEEKYARQHSPAHDGSDDSVGGAAAAAAASPSGGAGGEGAVSGGAGGEQDGGT